MRLLGTKLASVSSARGLGNFLWDVAGVAPSLDLRFAENKSLVDAVTGQNLVTFTRASAGTYVGSDGLIKTATTNLLLRSEEFTSASWILFGSASRSADVATAPNGSSTADSVTLPVGSGIYQGLTGSANTAYTFSIWLRSDTPRTVKVLINTNLSDPTAVTANVTTTWQRFSVTKTTAAGTNFLSPQLDTGGGATFYIWGAQLEQSSTVGDYVKTEATINSAPRFDHNPTTGESLGLLVEESRSNLLLNSETLATQSVTVSATAYTLSFYGTGTVTLSGVSTAGPLVGTGANARVSLTFTPTAGSLTLTVSGTVQYANLEAGSFPTSWVPTTASAATRSADVVDVLDAAIANGIRTLYLEFRSPASGTRGVASLNDNTANERTSVITSGTDPRLVVVDGGVEQANIDGGMITASTRTRVAVRINANDFAISINGGTPVTDTSGTRPTVDRLMLGRTQAGEYLNGALARVIGWRELLPDSTLQTITT